MDNNSNVVAGLMYVITIFCVVGIVADIVIWAIKKEDKLINYHFKQLLILWLAGIIIMFVGAIIPIIGWFLILPIGTIFLLIIWIVGMINAFHGKETALPIIGKWAEDWFKF